jgi:hypothetical protein
VTFHLLTSYAYTCTCMYMYMHCTYIDTEVWCTCHVKSSIYMSTYAETYMLLHAYACVLHVQSSHSHIHDIGVVTCMHRGFKYMHGAGRCRRGSSVPQSSPS